MPQEYSGIIMLLVFFAIMYFTMIRPQKKKEKQIKEMRDNLASGDEVITIGGIHGKVVKVNDEIVTLELPYGKQRMDFSKWAIGSVVKKGKEKPAKVEESSEDNDNDEK